MATTTKQQLIEDRALRNAAMRVVQADIGFIKSDLAQRSLGERFRDVAEDGAIEAADYAETHPGQVGGTAALVVGGIAAWIFRGHIADAIAGLFQGLSDEENEEDEPPCDARDAAERAERNKCCCQPVGRQRH